MKRSLSPSFCAALCMCVGGLCGVAGYYAGTGHAFTDESSRRVRRIGAQSNSAAGGGRIAGETRPYIDGWGAKMSGVINAARAGSPSAEYSALLQEAVKIGEPMAESCLLQALANMRPEDGPATYKFLLDLLKTEKGGHGFNVSRTWFLFWKRYGRVDVNGALAQADKDESSYGERDRVRKHIYIGWGELNPQTALERLATDQTLPERNRGIEGVSGEWAGHDPEATIRWALANLKGGDLTTALGAIQWGAVGLAGLEGKGCGNAVTLWENLPPSPESDAALRSLSQALLYSPYTKPEDRLQAVLAIEKRGLYDCPLLDAVSRDFESQNQAKEGLDMLVSLVRPAGSTNYIGFSRLARAWEKQDPAAARQWLLQQQGQPWYPAASKGMAQDAAR